MNIDSLLNNLLPPQKPVEIPTVEDFLAVEKQLGNLPDDYKTFIARYGTGVINHFIWILNPATANQHLNLVSGGEPVIGALRELRSTGERCPYALFPETHGLLPFGKTDNGDSLFWLRIGEPNQWPVVVNAARDAEYEKFDCRMTDFLEGILTRQLKCSIFPAEFPNEPPIFTLL